MTWVDLGNPRPRAELERYSPIEWPGQSIEKLPVPLRLPAVGLAEVVCSRRTYREFSELPIDGLAALCWLSLRGYFSEESALGFPVSYRVAPSAGAIHPIHVIVGDKKVNSLRRYDPFAHSLIGVDVSDDVQEGLWRDISEVLDPQAATVLLYAAEFGKTAAKYHASSSLIWRDAGVLIGHMALVAEALSLAFCPLGITGDQWCRQLDRKGRLAGVGVALVGARD